MDSTRKVVEQWLKAFAYTAVTNDIDAHLDMVAPEFQVVGISRRGFLDYEEWVKRRRNDMLSRRLLRLTYDRPLIKSFSDQHVAFEVKETIKSTLGEAFQLHKDVELQRGADSKWRAIEELIHSVQPVPLAGEQTTTTQ